ncbi:drug resistance transporter, Bcr/CflA subfamily [compost metagenome]
MAVTGFAVSMVALLAVILLGYQSLYVMAAFLFVGYGFLGLVIPTTAVLALEDYGEIAGTASALMGTLQFVIGGLAIAVTSAVFDGSPLPMVAGIAACAVLAFIIAMIALSSKTQPAETALTETKVAETEPAIV